MKLLDIFKGDEVESNIKSENKQMKKKIKNFKTAYNEIYEEKEDITKKYIALLEEKGEGFNQYIYYQNRCNEISGEIKEANKQNTILKNDMKSFKSTIGMFYSELSKIIPTASKCKNLNDIMLTMLLFYCSDRELPMNSIQNACKRCKVTRDKIKKMSSYLYDIYDVENWDIDQKKDKIIKEEK